MEDHKEISERYDRLDDRYVQLVEVAYRERQDMKDEKKLIEIKLEKAKSTNPHLGVLNKSW